MALKIRAPNGITKIMGTSIYVFYTYRNQAVLPQTNNAICVHLGFTAILVVTI